MVTIACQHGHRTEPSEEFRYSNISRSEAERSYEMITSILSPHGAVELKGHDYCRSYATSGRSPTISIPRISGLLNVAITALVCFDNRMSFGAKVAANLLFVVLLAVQASAAADPGEEILKEQTKARQEQKAKAAQRRQQLENLQRDQENQRQQQQLDQIKNHRNEPSEAQRPEAGQIQREIDQHRNDQQLERLQTEQQINRIQRETDPSRQQQQIDNLQRQQRIDSLQDQIRRNQTQQNLDRLRQK